MAASGTLVIRFIGDLREFERATGSLSKRLSTTGAAITKGVTVPLVGAGVAAGKTAMDFEKAMSLIQGLVGASEKQIARYSKVILTEGPKWGKAPQELADALYFVTSSGFKGAQALDVLEKSAKASTAGLGETQQVADLLTSAMNAYRKSGLSAAESTDILAKAIELGKLEPADLAAQMGQVLPIASSMGVKFHEVGAALSAMSMSGTTASEGTTQLRGILASLLKPTVEAEKTLESMGLSSEMLRNKIEKDGLLSVLELLRNKFDGNTASAAKVFGNVRALTGVMNMMGEQTDQTRMIFGEMGNASGALDKAFGAASDTAQFKLDKAMAQIKATLVLIGGTILPPVAAGFEKLAEFLAVASEKWSEMSPAAQKVALAIAAVAAAIGPALLVMGKILMVISKLTPHVRLVMVAVAAMVAVFSAARDKTSSFGEAIAMIAGFFTDGKFASAIQSAGQTIRDFVGAVLPTLKQVGTDVMNALVPAFAKIAELITTYVIPAFNKIMPVVAPVISFLIKIIGSALVGAIKGAVQFIEGIVNVIAGVFRLVSALVHGEWGKAWDALKQIVGGAIDAVIGALKVWFNVGILGIFKQGVKAIIGAWKGLWDDAVKLGKDAWNGIGSLVNKGVSAVGNLIKTGVTTYLNFWKGLFDDLVGLAVKGWQTLTSNFSKATGGIGTLIQTAVSNFVKFWTNLFSSLVSGAKAGWEAITGWFTRSLTSIATAVKNGVETLVAKFTSGMTSVKNAIQNPWDNVIKPVFDKLADIVKTVVPKAFETGVSAITKTWDKIKEAARKPVAFVVNTVWNEGLRRVINAIPGVDDLGPIKFARGGVLPGWTPGRDVHDFYSPTAGRLALSGGEAIMRPEFTRAVGGATGVDRLNRLARLGKLPMHAGMDVGFFLGGTMPAPRATEITKHSGYPWAHWAGDLNVPGSGDLGDPAVAWKTGVVASAAKWASSYGWHYRVNHPATGQQTLYAHLSRMAVNPGQVVRAGQFLGGIGQTGNASGPHLHFELAGGAAPVGGAAVAGSGTAAPVIDTGFIETIKKILSSVGSWFSALTNMGAWGGLVKSAASYAVDKVQGWIGGKIADVLGVVGDIKDGVVSLLKDAGSGLAGFVGGLFDQGGMLRHGGAALNMSGRPERVLDPRTTRNFEVLTQALNAMDLRPRSVGPMTPYMAATSGGAGGVRDIKVEITAASSSPRDIARATALALRMAL